MHNKGGRAEWTRGERQRCEWLDLAAGAVLCLHPTRLPFWASHPTDVAKTFTSHLGITHPIPPGFLRLNSSLRGLRTTSA